MQKSSYFWVKNYNGKLVKNDLSQYLAQASVEVIQNTAHISFDQFYNNLCQRLLVIAKMRDKYRITIGEVIISPDNQSCIIPVFQNGEPIIPIQCSILLDGDVFVPRLKDNSGRYTCSQFVKMTTAKCVLLEYYHHDLLLDNIRNKLKILAMSVFEDKINLHVARCIAICLFKPRKKSIIDLFDEYLFPK